MYSLAELLKHHVEENPEICRDAQIVVDKIYWAYMENNRIDSKKLDDLHEHLRMQINLPLREYDEVPYTISDLNLEYGRHAFMDGLKVGLLLMQDTGKNSCGTQDVCEVILR